MMISSRPFTTAGLSHDHPYTYNVCCNQLRGDIAQEALQLIQSGRLPYHQVDPPFGAVYVPEIMLRLLVGTGFRTHDPEYRWYIPRSAIIPIYYTKTVVTPAYGRRIPKAAQELKLAREIGIFLEGQRLHLPPRPFNLRAPLDEAVGVAPWLIERIEAGLMRGFRDTDAWWVTLDEALAMLPRGIYGEQWMMGNGEGHWWPLRYADHDQVERLIAEHRQHWPELYMPAPGRI